jgi:hypothetical protein
MAELLLIVDGDLDELNVIGGVVRQCSVGIVKRCVELGAVLSAVGHLRYAVLHNESGDNPD